MALRETKPTAPTLVNVALVIPSQKECGVYTYSHFLLDGFTSSERTKIEPVSNTCGNNLLSYAAFARDLESTHNIVHIQYEFGRFGKIGVSGAGTPFFYGAFLHPERVITTLHELPQIRNKIVHFFQQWFLNIIVEKSAKIIVHTQHMKTILHQWFPAQAEKIVVIPHGMYAPTKRPVEKRPAFLHGKKVIGFFGFLAPHKNVEAIIDALSLLPEEYTALIAGGASDENYAAALRQRAREKGVSSRIHWEGFVSNERMNDVFSWMDVVIFPYKSVTESGALHLALGSQRLVLASNLPAFKEIENHYGCISTYSNDAELVSQIRSLTTNSKMRKTLVAGMKKFIHERNWKKISQDHIAIYQKVSAQKN